MGLGGQSIFVDPARRLVLVHTAVRPSGDRTTSDTVALWRALQRTFPPL